MPRGKKRKSEATEETRFGTLVRIADDVANEARVAAALYDTSMAELISDTMRPILKKMVIEGLQRRVEGEGQGHPAPKKRGSL